jgi:hypothetical protein
MAAQLAAGGEQAQQRAGHGQRLQLECGVHMIEPQRTRVVPHLHTYATRERG